MEKSILQKNLFVVYLSLLSIVGFLATDTYLPAFDQMRIDLNTTANSISASLSIYLAGFAIAQLIWGPIADKWGNLKAILLGMSLFTISSFAVYLIDDVIYLLLLRVLQAVGACSAAVSWQALVIEHYQPNDRNKIFASIMPLVALSPALAPIGGAYLMLHFNWKFIFVAIGLLAFVIILYTLVLLAKDTSKEKSRESISSLNSNNYFSILKSKSYIGNVMIYGFCSAGFFAWLTGAPFFLKELGLNETEIGLSFVPQTITFMVGGYLYRWMSSKIEGKKLLPGLLILYAGAIVSVLLLSMQSSPSIALLLTFFSLMALSNGACYPIVVEQALSLFPKSSGKAAALQNTLQMGICFLASMLVSLFSKNSLMATAWVMLLTVPLAFIGYRLTNLKQKA